MGDVDDDLAAQALGAEGGEPPGDGGAEVVAHDVDLLAGRDLVREAEDVSGELVERVGGDVGRLVTGVVAALVEREDAQPSGGERLDLVTPAVPEIGEAVEEENWL